LDLGQFGITLYVELMLAEHTNEVCTELELPKPNLECLPTMRAPNINPSAPEVLLHSIHSMGTSIETAAHRAGLFRRRT
jgi:hypothetical protein